MPSVLIAEDEPAAARYLKSLVEAEEGYTVEALAGNGEEALAQIGLRRPDLVLTDVRMPVLDGLGLAARLRSEFPGLPLVIVSGHQEFEYARQALALGVVDYLLKPVDPAELGKLLHDLKARLEAAGDSAVLETLAAMAAGAAVPGAQIPERCLVSLVRWGGPLTRSAPSVPTGSTPERGFWVLPGRDAGEFLVLADAAQVPRDVFETRVKDLERPASLATATLLFTERPIPATDLGDTVRDLGPMLDRLLVPGHVRTHWGPVTEAPVLTLEPLWVQQVRLALQESAYHKLEGLVRGLVAEWENQERPARQTAILLRQLLLLAQNEAPNEGLRDWEFLFEEALGRVDSFADLADVAWSLFSGVAGLGPSATGSMDAPEAQQRIRRFLQTHYAEPLSIPVVCERFQLSQTSLSKLFRRYEWCTFHDYLTRLRLDAAERLLADSPGLPLKTVASVVGYQDPFHFSRAFKAAKGRPPSQRPEN
jgi:CheY-like chemotaxis protein